MSDKNDILKSIKESKESINNQEFQQNYNSINKDVKKNDLNDNNSKNLQNPKNKLKTVPIGSNSEELKKIKKDLEMAKQNSAGNLKEIVKDVLLVGLLSLSFILPVSFVLFAGIFVVSAHGNNKSTCGKIYNWIKGKIDKVNGFINNSLDKAESKYLDKSIKKVDRGLEMLSENEQDKKDDKETKKEAESSESKDKKEEQQEQDPNKQEQNQQQLQLQQKNPVLSEQQTQQQDMYQQQIQQMQQMQNPIQKANSSHVEQLQQQRTEQQNSSGISQQL